MANNFLLFHGSVEDDSDYPSAGGWDDFDQAFDTLELAKAHVHGEMIGYSWFEIVDIAQLKVVYNSQMWRAEITPKEKVLPLRFSSLWDFWQKGHVTLGEYYYLDAEDAWPQLEPIVNLMTWEGHAKWRTDVRAKIDEILKPVIEALHADQKVLPEELPGYRT